MTMKNICRMFLLAITVWSCNGSDNEVYYLSQPYTFVEDVRLEEKSPTRIISQGENYNACGMVIEDNLCILYTYQRVDFFFAIFDINSGEELGEFCRRGNGPQESSTMYPIWETYRRDGHILADIIDISKERLLTWDITASIETGHTIYDNIRPMKWLSESGTPPDFMFRMNDSELFMISAIVPFEDIGSVLAPRYEVRSAEDSSLLREYTVFRDSLAKFDRQGQWGELSPFLQKPAMHPKKKKLALCMERYPQLNILDLITGELKCFRPKGSPEITVSKNMTYYSAVDCNAEYIYALYQNVDNAEAYHSNWTKGLNPCQIHIFDWDGRLIAKWQLDEYYQDIRVYDDKLYVIKYSSGIMAEYDI